MGKTVGVLKGVDETSDLFSVIYGRVMTMRAFLGATVVGLVVTVSGCATADNAASEASPTESVAATASPEPTVALAPDTEVTPPLGADNQALDVITEGGNANSFDNCVQQYQELSQNLTVGGSVTPQLLQEWSDAYDDAAQSAAEADYGTAAAICNSLVTEIQSTLG